MWQGGERAFFPRPWRGHHFHLLAPPHSNRPVLSAWPGMAAGVPCNEPPDGQPYGQNRQTAVCTLQSQLGLPNWAKCGETAHRTIIILIFIIPILNNHASRLLHWQKLHNSNSTIAVLISLDLLISLIPYTVIALIQYY